MSAGFVSANYRQGASLRLFRDAKVLRLVCQLQRLCRCEVARPGSLQQRSTRRESRRRSWRARAEACSSATAASEDVACGFDSIPSALAALAAGEVVVVLDDESRENEGDLIMAADKMTTEAMAFFVEHTSGVVCVAMEGETLDRLALPLMVASRENEEALYTAFTVTVDARHGISTGISAADRALTVRLLADPSSRAQDFRRPGHIFPLRYRPGGVLARPGHTEAAVDLARLAGCQPAGVLCEVVNRADGSMARTPQLLAFACEHGLRCVTIADLLDYLHQRGAEAPQGLSANGANGVGAAGLGAAAAAARPLLDAALAA